MKYFQNLILTLVLTLAVAWSSGGVASALAVPSAPNQTAILDQANIIDDVGEATLSQKLIDYKKQTGNEIAVLTVKSLQGEDDFAYSYKVAESWGIGSKQANNGALLFVAHDEHKIRLQVGRGLEPYLTDLQSSLIIRQKIAPEFKKGNYTAGITSGIDSMIAVIGGERLSGSTSMTNKESLSGWLNLLFFGGLALSYFASFLARSKSWWAGGVFGAVPGAIVLFTNLALGFGVLIGGVGIGLLLDYLLSKNYRERVIQGNDITWWGSGGGFWGGSSGGSSGGFGGFGGGSFGGGGSGGSW